MTFEFSPDWMEALLRAPDVASTVMGTSPLMPPAAPPTHPDAREVAALVGELFAEGTLSVEQFHTLLAAPELEPYRHATLQPAEKTP
ncbi:protein of unknown function [Magnetospirillum sp. XM-1]|uniref:hypothetical protein n=1 Tax=Magnetospirillum sp. XM-1 TaxID=1663591 RepID=UPI00073DBFE2|nr:hypothetical protein [Magnetospirillum sp. XM-1]CUW40745.1 protein of unknown function [Magnetospirillum sp. XM-1]